MRGYKVKLTTLTNLGKIKVRTVKLEIIGNDVFQEEPALLSAGYQFSHVTLSTLSYAPPAECEGWLLLPENKAPLLWIKGEAFVLDPSEIR